MKKIIIKSLLLIPTLSIASDYVVVVDKKENEYRNDTFSDLVEYTEWIEISNECIVDIESNNVYKDKSFSQNESCTKIENRTKTTTRTYSGGKIETFTEKEEKIDTTNNVNNILGEHIEDSCLNALNFDSELTDGFYTIELKNSKNQEVYCDMVNGGWTLVSHIYDRDNRDDILNNSNGSAWGNSKNTPDSDTSFNIAISETPDFTNVDFQWKYPSVGDEYRHNANYLDLGKNRFNWSNPTPASSYTPWNYDSIGIPENYGYIKGVFGTHIPSENHIEAFGVLPYNHTCGGGQFNDKAMHYWGYGSIIDFGSGTTYELHNLDSSISIRPTFEQGGFGCGTRNSILNIWIK